MSWQYSADCIDQSMRISSRRNSYCQFSTVSTLCHFIVPWSRPGWCDKCVRRVSPVSRQHGQCVTVSHSEQSQGGDSFHGQCSVMQASHLYWDHIDYEIMIASTVSLSRNCVLSRLWWGYCCSKAELERKDSVRTMSDAAHYWNKKHTAKLELKLGHNKLFSIV